MRTKVWKQNRKLVLREARNHFKALTREIGQGLIALLVLMGWPFYHGFRYLRAKNDSKQSRN